METSAVLASAQDRVVSEVVASADRFAAGADLAEAQGAFNILEEVGRG